MKLHQILEKKKTFFHLPTSMEKLIAVVIPLGQDQIYLRFQLKEYFNFANDRTIIDEMFHFGIFDATWIQSKLFNVY